MNIRLERFHMLGWNEVKISETFDMFGEILKADYDIMLEMTPSSGLARDMTTVYREIRQRQTQDVKFEIHTLFREDSQDADRVITILRIIPSFQWGEQ